MHNIDVKGKKGLLKSATFPASLSQEFQNQLNISQQKFRKR